MSDFWQFFWVIVEIFLFVAYLLVLFNIIADLFRDSQMGGFAKALWVVVLIVIPLIGSLIYLIVRGRGMNQRLVEQRAAVDQATRAYVREAAGTGPAQEIQAAQELLDRGAIDAQEFQVLKARALR